MKSLLEKMIKTKVKDSIKFILDKKTKNIVQKNKQNVQYKKKKKNIIKKNKQNV